MLPARDARNYELDTLTPQDGAQLFLNIARNAGYFDRNPRLSNEELAILSAIVERLGGYPLAIEVVAGQTESRTLDDIWNDLVKMPKNVLEGKDELTGEPRGVWTSLGFSYKVLPAPAQTLFCRMGVFLAPATVEDVEAVVGDDRQPPTDDSRQPMDDGRPLTGDRRPMMGTREVLDTLVKRSLVRMREGAYALLPIVREYALSQLEESGSDVRELHARAVNHYRQKGTLEGALIASEHLFELAARYDARGAAEVFVEYVIGFYPSLKTRGYWAEARRKNEQMIMVARALGDKVTEAQAIGELGSSYQDIGEYARAAELHRQALEALAASDDKRGVAVALHYLGNVAYLQGDYAEARRLYGESLKLREELGDKQGIAQTLHQLGVLAQDQGEHREARRLYSESLKIQEELGDKRGIAATLYQIGTILQRDNNLKDALRNFLIAAQIAVDLNHPNLPMALARIDEIRKEIGEKQFEEWVREMSQ